ncbi:MAG: rRNA maturation RNase YbeY [Gemmatimonadaceae bacterium]
MRSDDPPQRRPRTTRATTRAPSANGVVIESELARLPLGRVATRRLALLVLRAEGAGRAHMAITFVTPARIARLHRRFLGKRGDTDIVTLEHARSAPGAPLVGEIYIAPAVARANAQAFGVPWRDEMARLVVHGVLHALGWDHPEDDRRSASPMWRRQEALLRAARRAGVMAR